MTGLLEQMLQMGPEEASFGSRYHAQLYSGSLAEIQASFKRDNWTCQNCKVRIPGFMEVDHAVHKPHCAVQELSTICQFCHNLKHPIWASLRGRLRLFWLPGIPQEMVTRMAWTVFYSIPLGHIPDYYDSAENILERVGRREVILADILGSSDVGGLLESLHTIRRFREPQNFWPIIRELDGFVRFWPTAVNNSYVYRKRQSASLSYWSEGKFIDLAQESKINFWDGGGDPEDYLIRLMDSNTTVTERLSEIGSSIYE